MTTNPTQMVLDAPLRIRLGGASMDYEAMYAAARDLLTHPYDTPWAPGEAVLNCALASQIILERGGVEVSLVASMVPWHPLFAPSFRFGVRAHQFGSANRSLTGVVLHPLDRPDYSPVPHQDLYLQQRIFQGASNPDQTASDRPATASYDEHTLAIVWHDEQPFVFNARRSGNALIPFAAYLKSEMEPSQRARVQNWIARLSPQTEVGPEPDDQLKN